MNTTLSVITICFNNREELAATCRSVDAQSHKPDEHLIIDGSTNDDIVDWLKNNAQPTYRRWIHERDNGISDAFNKGIHHAQGAITHLLNSGDAYANANAIATAIDCFKKDPSLMWLHGQYIQHRGGVDVVSGVPFDPKQLWKGMRTVAHPSMFIRREVYQRHGVYNTAYKIAMDYDMLVRMRKEPFRFVHSPLVYFAPGGASNIHFRKGLKEVRNSYRKEMGFSGLQTAWQTRQHALHLFMQTGAGKKWFQWKNRRRTKGIS